MVLRVKPTPTRFPINRLYTPMDNTSLYSTLYASIKFSNQPSLSNASREILNIRTSTHLFKRQVDTTWNELLADAIVFNSLSILLSTAKLHY